VAMSVSSAAAAEMLEEADTSYTTEEITEVEIKL